MRQHLLDAVRQIGDAIVPIMRQDASRQRKGVRHIAIRQRGDQRPFGEFPVVRIGALRLAEEGRRRECVAFGMSDDRRQIIARQAGPDLERPRHGQAFACVRGHAFSDEAAGERQRQRQRGASRGFERRRSIRIARRRNQCSGAEQHDMIPTLAGCRGCGAANSAWSLAERHFVYQNDGRFMRLSQGRNMAPRLMPA